MSATAPAPTRDFDAGGIRARKWIFAPRLYADGGCASEVHHYTLGDAPYAVSFTVQTGRYPEGRGDTAPSGSDVSWHREAEHGHAGCYALSGGRCMSEGSVLDAMEWYADAPKGSDGLVPDDAIFHFLRGCYADWSKR